MLVSCVLPCSNGKVLKAHFYHFFTLQDEFQNDLMILLCVHVAECNPQAFKKLLQRVESSQIQMRQDEELRSRSVGSLTVAKGGQLDQCSKVQVMIQQLLGKGRDHNRSTRARSAFGRRTWQVLFLVVGAIAKSELNSMYHLVLRLQHSGHNRGARELKCVWGQKNLQFSIFKLEQSCGMQSNCIVEEENLQVAVAGPTRLNFKIARQACRL